MSNSPTKVVFDQWDTYATNSEDGPLFITFDVAAAENDLTDTLPHCARVMIPIQSPNDNGGPVEPESDRLYEMEDELCAALTKAGVSCREVARLTCAGVRELVFQLDDWKTFRVHVGRWIKSQKDYHIDVSEHEGWDFFNDCIRPTPEVWQYLGDQSVVRNLLKAGSNPEKEHDIEFVFLGEAAGLKLAAAALQARDYAPLPPVDFDSGEVVMVKRLPLDVDAIFTETLAHVELAEAQGIKYDGWGAMVVE